MSLVSSQLAEAHPHRQQRVSIEVGKDTRRRVGRNQSAPVDVSLPRVYRAADTAGLAPVLDPRQGRAPHSSLACPTSGMCGMGAGSTRRWLPPDGAVPIPCAPLPRCEGEGEAVLDAGLLLGGFDDHRPNDGPTGRLIYGCAGVSGW